MALKMQRHLGAPHHVHHPVSGKETNTYLAWDSVLFGNTGDLYQRCGSNTTTPSYLAGASCGRHGTTWQIQPDRGSSDRPKLGCSVLWAAIIREDWAWARHEMPHSHCQELSVGLANKPNLVPILYAWVKAHGWSPKPSPKGTLNQEGLDILAPFHLHWHHSIFIIKTCLCDKQASQQLLNDGRFPNLVPGQCIMNEAECHSKDRIEVRGNESYGQPHLSHLPPCQIVDSKVTKVQHQLPHQCHQGLKDLEVLDIHAMANSLTGSLEAKWRSTCQSSRMRTQKMLSHTKVGVGTWQFIITLDARITPFSPMPFVPCKVTWESKSEVWGWTSPWMMYSPYWMSTTTMSRP